MKKRPALAVVAAYALLAVTVIPVFPHFVSPNELTRWVLAAALVEDHTVEVSRPAALLGRRFEDLAERDGHLYSNKAPGVALVSVPGYVAGRAFFGPPSPRSIRPVLTSMRLIGATLPLLLLALLFVHLGRQARIDETRIASVVWLLLFATPLFAYGLLLFSHALVAAALFGAWAFLFFAPPRAVLAGALLGLAVASEYPAGVPTAVILLVLAVSHRWRDLARVIAGAAPAAIVLGVYQHLAFGSAFRLSPLYDRLPEYRALGRSGMFGLQMPSLSIAGRLLFDPGRGLLVFAPVLLLAIPALIAAKKRMQRASFWTLILMPLSLFLVYASYPNWHGGWATGPRYVVACVPFLVFPMLYRRTDATELVLGGWSAAAVTITALVFPFVPNAFPLPWSTLALPLLREGLIAPNLLHLVARPLAIAAPIAIVVASALVFGRRALLTALGAIAALAIGLAGFRMADEPVLTLQRDYIAGVYFERNGALKNAPPRLLVRRAGERRLPPTSWPFGPVLSSRATDAPPR